MDQIDLVDTLSTSHPNEEEMIAEDEDHMEKGEKEPKSSSRYSIDELYETKRRTGYYPGEAELEQKASKLDAKEISVVYGDEDEDEDEEMMEEDSSFDFNTLTADQIKQINKVLGL